MGLIQKSFPNAKARQSDFSWFVDVIKLTYQPTWTSEEENDMTYKCSIKKT